MPTYEYRCPEGHHFELFQKMSDEPRAECPECGENSERLLSAGVGFLFKGDGFYITDNRSASYRKDASNEDTAGSSAKEKPSEPKEDSGAKTESKPAKDPPSGPPSKPSGGDSSPKGS